MGSSAPRRRACHAVDIFRPAHSPNMIVFDGRHVIDVIRVAGSVAIRITPFKSPGGASPVADDRPG